MLNTAQNKKLLVKLTRALETYEPYVFTEICTLPFSMYSMESDRGSASSHLCSQRITVIPCSRLSLYSMA